MKANEKDLRIEEMEERAVDKSNVAKTAAVAGVMGVAGAGLAVAASQVILDSGDEDASNTITVDDLTEGAIEGAEETNIIVKTPAGEGSSHEAPTPPEIPNPHSSMTVEDQLNLYDSDGNLLYSETSGQFEGKKYVFIDSDGDRIVDKVGYDVDGNQIIDEDEMRNLSASEQFMTQDLGKPDHVTDLIKHELPGGEEPGDPGDIVPPGDDELPIPEDPEPEPEPEPEPNDPDYFLNDNQDFNNDADVSEFI